jgi:hypothetical protein
VKERPKLEADAWKYTESCSISRTTRFCDLLIQRHFILRLRFRKVELAILTVLRVIGFPTTIRGTRILPVMFPSIFAMDLERSRKLLPVNVDSIKPVCFHELVKICREPRPISRSARNVAPYRLSVSIVIAKCPSAEGDPNLKPGSFLLQVCNLRKHLLGGFFHGHNLEGFRPDVCES